MLQVNERQIKGYGKNYLYYRDRAVELANPDSRQNYRDAAGESYSSLVKCQKAINAELMLLEKQLAVLKRQMSPEEIVPNGTLRQVLQSYTDKIRKADDLWRLCENYLRGVQPPKNPNHEYIGVQFKDGKWACQRRTKARDTQPADVDGGGKIVHFAASSTSQMVKKLRGIGKSQQVWERTPKGWSQVDVDTAPAVQVAKPAKDTSEAILVGYRYGRSKLFK